MKRFLSLLLLAALALDGSPFFFQPGFKIILRPPSAHSSAFLLSPTNWASSLFGGYFSLHALFSASKGRNKSSSCSTGFFFPSSTKTPSGPLFFGLFSAFFIESTVA